MILIYSTTFKRIHNPFFTKNHPDLHMGKHVDKMSHDIWFVGYPMNTIQYMATDVWACNITQVYHTGHLTLGRTNSIVAW